MRWARTHRLPLTATVVAVLAAATLVIGGGLASAVTGPVVIGGTRPADVGMSGGRVVWADRASGNYDIYVWDAATGETTQLTTDDGDQLQPAIDGDLVVWTDYRDGDADIWMHDLLTGTSTHLIDVANDQVEPSISGTWVVWEDYRTGYSPAIYGMDVAAPIVGGFKIASGSSQPKRRPVVGGDLVVWEDYRGQTAGRGDPDILGADLATFDPAVPVYIEIAAEAGPSERTPWTDGRYVVYSRDDSGDSDIWAWDAATSESFALAEQAGEQAAPVVAGGRAYWLDNSGGNRLHYDTYTFETGRQATFNSYGTGDMADLHAGGNDAAWLESAGGDWKVRAVVNDDPATAFTRALSGLPLRLSWIPQRLAQLVTGGDQDPPIVLSSTVKPGETEVEADRSLAVYFDEDLDPATVGDESVTLVDDLTGEPLEAKVTYAALADAVTVEPAEPLGEGSYTLAVSGEVADEAGNVLGQDYVVSFSRYITFNADTIPPTRPRLNDMRTVGVTHVELTWTPSTDNVGVVGYEIWRYGVPITTSNIGLAELAGTALGAGTSTIQVPVDDDEMTPRKYTLYYVVRAYDAEGNKSQLSANMLPNPHGTQVVGANTSTCAMCHTTVHGAAGSRPMLNAKSAEACYECHGDTEATGAYGYGSTIDTEYQFFEDAGDSGRLTASRHRSDYAMSTQQECDMCHTPHRKPANVDLFGVKDNATSYSKLLRRPSDPGVIPPPVYLYSTDAVPFDNNLCFSCHGTQSAYMVNRAGATAYADSGGDHDTGFTASAHGPTMVLAGTRPAGDPGPATTCAACHNEHATQTKGLTDWRRTGARDATYNQAGLCFACHGADYTNETRTNSAKAYYAWNERDLQAEFSKDQSGGSNHPYQAEQGDPLPIGGNWNQTSQAAFAANTRTDVDATSYGGGAAELTAVGGGATLNYLFRANFETSINPNTGTWANSTNWTRVTNSPYAGENTARMNSTNECQFESGTMNTSGGLLNLAFHFELHGTGPGTTENTDYVRVYFRDSGSNWDLVWQKTLEDQSSTWEDIDLALSDAQYQHANFRFRIYADASATNEYQWVDDVQVTWETPAPPSGYKGSGNIIGPTITVPGTHYGWKQLVVNTEIPAGTGMTVDVINPSTGLPISGYNDYVLAAGTNTIPLALPAGIDHNTVPQIKLRADLAGDVVIPSARVASDNFDDNSFDTADPPPRWFDVPTLGGATDPDAGEVLTAYARPTGDITDTGDSWDTHPLWSKIDEVPTPNDSDYITANGSTECQLTINGFTIPAGSTNITVEAVSRAQDDTSSDGSNNYWVRWRTGSTWRSLSSLNPPGNGSGWQTYTQTISEPGDGVWTVAEVNAINGLGLDSSDWDPNPRVSQLYLRVTYTTPSTTEWPKETSNCLKLRAEGVDFAGTTDEGYYVYMSSADYSWFGSGGWDAVAKVTSHTNSDADGRAGLMLRTGNSFGTASGDALNTGAKTVGVYLTGSGSVEFVTRSASGGSTTAQTVASVAAPRWLRIGYNGAGSFTGWYSTDGVTWTQIGSASSVALGTVTGVGLAQTSGTDSDFQEATFDDYSVTERVTIPNATKTPRLLDWTVTYDYLPVSASDGQLTCANCHNTHNVRVGGTGVWSANRVSDPNNTKTMWTGDIETFCLRCHDSSAPTAQMAATTIVPYSVGFTDMSTKPFFPGWDKTVANVNWSSSGHAASTIPIGGGQTMNLGCENCHDPHGSDNKRLTALTLSGSGATHPTAVRNNTSTYREQNLCYGCHTSNRTPNCVSAGCHTSAFNMLNVQTAMSQTYGHGTPMAQTGRHSDTEGAANFAAGTTRHVECADCHDPHAARAGRHAARSSVAGEALRGATGVKPTYPATEWGSATGWTVVRIRNGAGNDFEAYVCMKCHSAYTTLPAKGTSTPTRDLGDIGREFNPANESGHNVMGTVWPKTSGLGASNNRTWTLPSTAAMFTGSWTSSSQVTCSDCHTSATGGAVGPHGSSVKYMLDPAYALDWETAYLNQSGLSGLICSKCHNSNYRGMNNVHSDGDHSGTTDARCIGCHIKVPHGWKRPRLLGYRSDPEPYRALYLTGITDRSYTPSGWNKDYCGQSGCGEHGSSPTSPVWP